MGYTSMASHRLILAVPIILLVGCSSLPLGMLGGGPNVAANTQIGRENNQSVFQADTGPSAGRDVIQKDVEADVVDSVTITNEKIPVWVIIALVLGWLAPSPSEIGRGIAGLFMRRTDK
jgi:hypothetical protein